VGGSDTFAAALDRALDFAGPSNYCPVLAGSIGGARWGRAAIPQDALRHAAAILPRAEVASAALAEGWGGSRPLRAS
jgi:hypothetical protein